MSKTIKTRIAQKHDYELNWAQATGFTPMAGEIIIYDAETQQVVDSIIETLRSKVPSVDVESLLTSLGRTSQAVTYQRIKIGNGTDNVNDLPFVVDFGETEKTLDDYLLKADAVGRKTGTGAEAFNNSNTIASGAYSHAEGTKTQATAENAHAEGWGTEAKNNNAHAEGGGSKAYGNSSHAEGNSTEASGSTAHSEGYVTKAKGDQSHAGGQYSTAAHGVSFVHGDHLETGRTYQAVFGTYNEVTDKALFVVGNGNSTERKNAFTVDSNNTAYVGTKKVLVEGDIPTNISAFTNDANYSTIGRSGSEWNAEIFNDPNNTATKDHAHAEGYRTNATGSKAHSEGSVTTAEGEASHAEGGSTHAAGPYSHTEGYKTKTTNNNAHAEGNSTEASGQQAHAEGYATIASSNQAHAEGANTEATASAAHAEGYMTHANGNFSHAEGTYNISEGGSSHTEGGHARNADQSIRVGGKNIAAGGSSHAEGISTRAGASFEHFAAHAEGAYTEALAPYAHAEGVGHIGSTVFGDIEFDSVEGQSKINTGHVNYDHDKFSTGDVVKIVELTDTYTGKSYDVTIIDINPDTGRIEVDMNFDCGSRYDMYPISPTIASGYASHASGICTIASAEAQTVVGKFNEENDNALFIVGNGGDDYSRHNAFWITQNGEAYTNNGKLITENDVPNIPTKLSELENDTGYSTVGKKDENNGEVFNSHSNNRATGAYSHAEGANTKATGDHSHAEGHSTVASGEDTHAEGRDTTASGVAAHAEGWVTTASGKFSHAEGHTTHAEGDFSHAAGRDTFAIGNFSYADGQATRAEGAHSRASGWGARALGEYSFAHGIRANATAKNAYAFGADTTASGHHSVAFNNETVASGTESMATGYATRAEGSHSFASGSGTVAIGTNARATGHFTIARGDNSYAGGYGTYGASFTALLHGSHIDENGYIDMIVNIPSSVTLNVGDYIVINYKSQAYVVQTLGFNEVGSECCFTPSIYVGEEETFFDTNCNINIMHATEAAHNNSFAHGVEVKTGRDSQAVFGRYNSVSNEDLFVIGNGGGDGSRKNAFVVKEDGTAYVDGKQVITTDSAIGKVGVGNGSEVFNDSESNQAFGEYSHAEGISTTAYGEYGHAEGYNSVAGSRGYYIVAIDTINNVLAISKTNTGITFKPGELDSLMYPTDPYDPEFDSGYSVGDVVTLCLGPRYDLFGTIRYIDGNYISLDGRSLVDIESEIDLTAKNPSITVPSKPDVGVAIWKAGAHAQGVNTLALGMASHAEGSGSVAMSDIAHAEGSQTEAYLMAHAEGKTSKARGEASHAEGIGTAALGKGAHAEGVGNGTLDTVASEGVASGSYSHSEGITTIASDSAAHAEGRSTIASADASHSEGKQTTASGVSSHAEGSGTTASGSWAHAEGGATTASGIAAHAAGDHTTALGDASHSEGKETQAGAACSHAEGELTIASAQGAHAEGKRTNAQGEFSHAEGKDTSAEGPTSHAEGWQTKAVGDTAHSEGRYTTASGIGAHAEGSKTIASGVVAHAEGVGAEAKAEAAHAEGYYTIAAKKYSHAAGIRTETSREGQFVVGEYNEKDLDALFIVGNGDEDTIAGDHFVRNAFVVRKDGTAKSPTFEGDKLSTTTNYMSRNTIMEPGVLSVNDDSMQLYVTTTPEMIELRGVSYDGEIHTNLRLSHNGILLGNTLLTEEKLQKLLAFIDSFSLANESQIKSLFDNQ